jgi:nucleoside-diphosphate-sugar epimerase
MIAVNGGGRFNKIPVPADRKKIDIGSYTSDLTKIRSTLGWQPLTRLRDGLAKTLEYYRIHRDRYW